MTSPGSQPKAGSVGPAFPFDEPHVEVRLDEPASRTFAQVLKSGVHGTLVVAL
jgi:hypothetical protein